MFDACNKMIRETSLIMQMQLAIMGVVLVFGLFYLWRSTCRMEEKMDVLMNQIVKLKENTVGNACYKCPMPGGDIDPAEAEEFMKQVFGGDIMFMDKDSSKHVMVEEVVDEEEPLVVQEHAQEHAHEHAHEHANEHEQESEADINNPLSKSKLKRMNLDTLKTLCEERGFSTDGSKTILMNRLLGLSRE